jgi:hypothetical protein
VVRALARIAERVKLARLRPSVRRHLSSTAAFGCVIWSGSDRSEVPFASGFDCWIGSLICVVCLPGGTECSSCERDRPSCCNPCNRHSEQSPLQWCIEIVEPNCRDDRECEGARDEGVAVRRRRQRVKS